MNICPQCGYRLDRFPCHECGYEPVHIDGFTAYAPNLAREAPGFDPKHYRSLAELEAGNFWFRSRNALILWAISRFSRTFGTYLEIGCGTGYVTSAVAKAFPGLQTTGSEIFVEGLSIAAIRAPSTHFFQMDARRIPYASAFDVIGAFDVIEHIEEDESVLREMHRALQPCGVLLITVPQHRWLWSAQDEYAHHVRRYTRSELLEKVERAGFSPLWHTSFVSILLPVMLLSRMRSGKGDAADPCREFRIPAWLNSTLYAVMRVEIALIKAGIRMPVGGSLLLVARKETE